MRVDVRALGTFNRLAHEGAEHAAASLAQMTSVDPTVEATQIDFVSRSDVGDAFEDRPFVGVEIGFAGGLDGTTVLALERDGADDLLAGLPGPGGDVESQISELGNILLAGFIDGWADYLGTTIDITPPTYIEGSGRDVLPEGAMPAEEHEQVFAFTSKLHAATASTTAYIYMFPRYDSFADRLETQGDGEAGPIPLDRLAVFNQMTKQGARNASDNITSLTGIETTVEISKLSFVPIEVAPKQISDERYVGTVVEFEGTPSGYVVILFDEPSARAIVGELLPGGEIEEFDEMGQSAMEEIGNIMTSGFVDGWANVLETSIDISPPQFVHDLGQAIVDPIAVQLGRSQEFAFMIDSTINTPGREIACDIYALPDGSELRRALESLDVDPVESVDAEEDPFPEMEASYEDL